LEDGSEKAMGEWPSRRIGKIIPPFDLCEIAGRTIKHSKEAVPLWPAAPEATVREKVYIFVFQVGGKKFVSEMVRCSFPYDLNEIVNFGHTLSAQISEQSALAEFPAQPWPERVQIQGRIFRDP
jgi:hypothetical protein